MTIEHVSVPCEDYEALVRLSRRALHTAYVWNDHNHQPVKALARKDAVDFGIRSINEANDFLDKSEALLSRATPSDTSFASGLVNEGLDYFYKAGDEGDKEYVRAIRAHIAALEKPSAPRVVTGEIDRLLVELHDYADTSDAHLYGTLSTSLVRDYVAKLLEAFATSLPVARVPDVKSMVDRFLGWKLPNDFAPDGGVTFNRHYNTLVNGKVTECERTYGDTWWPIGTNLLTAEQAEQMFSYVLAAAPKPEKE